MFIKNGKRITLTTGMVVEVPAKDADGKDIIEEVQLVLPVSAERLAELGITEVPDPVRPDDRFNFVSENADGTFTATPKPREQTNAMVWDQIKAKRDALKAGGIKVGTKWYHTDEASRTQYIGLLRMADAAVAAGGSGTTTLQYSGQDIQWKTMDGSFIKMTVQRANDVFAAVSGLDFTAFGVAETHRAAMEASADPATYDFSTGWPETFGG